MPRRNRVFKKREVPDAKYGSLLVTRMINTIMHSGRKSAAERIVYGAIAKMNEKSDAVDPLELFHKAIDNVKPRLEVKSRRVGGATYQVPIEVATGRQVSLAMRWLVDFARKRRGRMVDALATEIREAATGQGNVIKKRDDVHKMAQANRAFAHLRW